MAAICEECGFDLVYNEHGQMFCISCDHDDLRVECDRLREQLTALACAAVLYVEDSTNPLFGDSARSVRGARLRKLAKKAIKNDGAPCIAHKWKGVQCGGGPTDPPDYTQVCQLCGMENQED